MSTNVPPQPLPDPPVSGEGTEEMAEIRDAGVSGSWEAVLRFF